MILIGLSRACETLYIKKYNKNNLINIVNITIMLSYPYLNETKKKNHRSLVD